MRQQMATKEMIVIPDDDEESCAAVSKSPPPAAPVKPPPPARTPPRAPSTPPPARPSSRSPPRYPSTSPGTAKVANVPVLRLEADGRQMSPRAANIRALGTAFNNADLQTDEDEITWALEEIDSEGGYNAMAYDNDGYDFTFQLRNGLKYNYGHGRNRCSYRQLRLQQGLVAPRPVQAVRRQVRGRILLLPPVVPARLPCVQASPQMRRRGGRERREEGLR
jgi:hypothetical protein